MPGNLDVAKILIDFKVEEEGDGDDVMTKKYRHPMQLDETDVLLQMMPHVTPEQGHVDMVWLQKQKLPKGTGWNHRKKMSP